MAEMQFIYVTKDGRSVDLIWDECQTMMSVFTNVPTKQKIGHIEFSLIEDSFGLEHLHVTNMFLEGPNGTRAFVRQGIGGHIIRRVKELGYSVTFSADDGLQRPDGSQLTGTGVPFAHKMVEKGLATFGG